MVDVNTGNALGVAVEGLKRQETRVAKATEDLNANLVAAQNQLAAASAQGQAPSPAPAPAEDGVAQDSLVAARVADADITRPLVTLLEAKTAYSANLKAVSVAGDIQQETINMLGKRTRIEA